MSYPGPHQRGGLFALDFLKVLHRAGAVGEILPSGVCLVSAVALAEHQVDYLRPPDFWNGQLMTAAGMSDEDAFVVCRQRCLRAGWLVYVRGRARNIAGKYWVRVPDGLESLLRLPRVTRGNTQDKTPDNTQVKTPPKTPVKTPVKTPELPHPLPSRGGSGEHPPTPPGGKKEQNQAALQRVLRKAGMRSTMEAALEWADLAQGVGGCRTVAAVIDCVAWVLDQCLRRKLSVQFAREARELVIEYAQQGPG